MFSVCFFFLFVFQEKIHTYNDFGASFFSPFSPILSVSLFVD